MEIPGTNRQYLMRPFTLTIMSLRVRAAILWRLMTQRIRKDYSRHIEQAPHRRFSPDGTQVNIIKADHYNITTGKRQEIISGQSDITIGGRHKIYINKDGQQDNNYDIQVGPNANVNIQIDKGNMNVVLKEGKMNTNVSGDYNMKVGGNYNLKVEGNRQVDITGTTTDNTQKAVLHTGQTYKVLANRIDLNE